MVLNVGKCYLICLGNNTENETFLFYKILIEKKNKKFSVL